MSWTSLSNNFKRRLAHYLDMRPWRPVMERNFSIDFGLSILSILLVEHFE